jgi:beta-lactamase class A
MQAQAFWRDAVEIDQDTLDASGQPQVQRLDTGLAYLRTAGPPPVEFSSPQMVWSQGDTALLDAPGSGQPVAHIGQNFPLTLMGGSWNAGALWYQAQWTVPKSTGSGWIPATAITFASPGNVPAWASFDVLSPGLARYLASTGSNVNAVVYDVMRQRYYTYHPNAQFIMGSSMKVPIMLTFLDMTEREGRQPTDDEMNLLTTMIENSNNDSASALYYGEIGGAAGVAGYLQRIGITGLNPDPDAWGYSLVSPLTMVNILTLLYEGKILTTQDRNLALYLMENIEPDQQVGVGDTAPQGATAAMKDGWLTAPDGYWAMNSSGIVTRGSETYIISVYTAEQNSLADGQAIAEHFCSAIASLLT